MVRKTKTTWKKSHSNDFCEIESKLKKLSQNGLYSSQNAFFQNDVFAYVASKESDSGLDYAKRNVVLDILHHARKFAPGTEILLTDMIINNNSYKTIKVERISSKEARDLTLQQIKSKQVQSIFKNITDLMGTTGRIHVSEEPISQTELKLSDGCQINVSIDPRFAKLSDVLNINFDYISVCIIEGAPASVSEINKLLMYCFENKIALMLMTRSFPEEVINTLSVNWNNKKLRVLPFIYGNDVYNINSHADLASVSGAMPISPMKGDSLQGTLSEKFGSLLNFTNKGSYVTAKPTSDPRVLIDDLKSRLSKVDYSSHDKIKILSKRISDLSDKTLYVKIPKSEESWRIKNELDIAIAIYNSYCSKTIVAYRNDKKIKLPYSIYKKAEELQNIYRETKENIGGYVVYSDKKKLNNK